MNHSAHPQHPAALALGDELTLAGYRWRWLEGTDGLTVLVDCAEWRPTGRELAAFPDDAEALLELAPDYPFVRVSLPPAPAAPTSMAAPRVELEGRLRAAADRLRAAARWNDAIADWLLEAGGRIDEAAAHLRREAEWIRRSIETTRYGDWHVNGCNQFTNTVKVQGRDLKLSPGHPTGSPDDLSTIFLGPLLEGVWRADYRPQLRVEAADYGSCRVKVQVGRRGRAMPSYWVDLRAWTLSSKPSPADRRATARRRTSGSAR